MSSLTRLAVLIATTLSLVTALSATAGAVTWHNSGDTFFHATTGPTTFSATGSNGMVCPSGGTLTATMRPTPFVGTIWPAFDGTEKWAGCQLGATGWTIDCILVATEFNSPLPGYTTGNIHSTCAFFLAGVKVCHVTGVSHYLWDEVTTPETLTTTTGGETLVTNGSGGTCPLGSNDKVHLNETTWPFDAASGGPAPHHGPHITRTS